MDLVRLSYKRDFFHILSRLDTHRGSPVEQKTAVTF